MGKPGGAGFSRAHFDHIGIVGLTRRVTIAG
jgi:hypothetical protein